MFAILLSRRRGYDVYFADMIFPFWTAKIITFYLLARNDNDYNDELKLC